MKKENVLTLVVCMDVLSISTAFQEFDITVRHNPFVGRCLE